jgi:hypothetical protein
MMGEGQSIFWMHDERVYHWKPNEQPVDVTPPDVIPVTLRTNLDGVWCYGEDGEWHPVTCP